MDCPRSDEKGGKGKKDKERYTDTHSINPAYSICCTYCVQLQYEEELQYIKFNISN
jgi:hypothetical protein